MNNDLLLEKLKKDYEKFFEINKQLCYPEIQSDAKLFLRLEKEQNTHKNGYETYLKILQIDKDIIKIAPELNSVDFEIKTLAEEEILNKKKVRDEILNEYVKSLESYDFKNFEIEILSQNTESFETLVKMYENYCKKKSYSFMLKKNILSIYGNFSDFRFENGYHNIVVNGKNQLCSVTVTEYQTLKELDISKVKIETFRSSGAGGQHINRTDSAVRVIDTETGIVAICQDERSQIRNRDRAIENLKEKVNAYYLDLLTKSLVQQKKKLLTDKKIIRNYDKKITDTRLPEEVFNFQDIVENGNLEKITDLFKLK